MKQNKNNKRAQVPENHSVVCRLDAIIRLISDYFLITNKENFNTGTIAKALNSVGLTPTEIATILGKKSATDVAGYLYRRKGK